MRVGVSVVEDDAEGRAIWGSVFLSLTMRVWREHAPLCSSSGAEILSSARQRHRGGLRRAYSREAWDRKSRPAVSRVDATASVAGEVRVHAHARPHCITEPALAVLIKRGIWGGRCVHTARGVLWRKQHRTLWFSNVPCQAK